MVCSSSRHFILPHYHPTLLLYSPLIRCTPILSTPLQSNQFYSPLPLSIPLYSPPLPSTPFLSTALCFSLIQKQCCKKISKTMFYLPLLSTARGLGCFGDTSRRAIPTLEGKSRLLTGSYRSRWDAIRKCASSAYIRGYRVFGVQHGGWCAASRTAFRTYAKYGKSNRCRNGKGGPWANDVYVLKGERHFV